MNEEYKSFIVPYAISIVVLLIIVALSFCFLFNNRSGDAGVGERIDAATAVIGESRKQQSAITSGIEEAEREAAITVNIEKVYEILKDAKVNYISELINKPVEVTIDKNCFKDFRILTEVL